MGIALPQLAPASEDRVSGAQVIDGSLKFQSVNKNYLYQTIDNGTSGFTLSLWMKPFQTGDRDEIFDTIASTGFYIYRHTDGSIRINNNSTALFTSNGLYRDIAAFYHIVFSYNSTAGDGTLWVNGRVDKSTTFATQLYAGTAKISSDASSDPAEYSLAQWYLIDGLALGPSYFAYTDPLTGTWRPKKFRAQGTTVNDGTVWSNASMSGDGTVSNKTNAFDGGISNAAGSTGTNTNLTFTFTKSIPVKNSVRVYHNQSGTIKINNETAVSTSSGGANWVTLFKGQTNFTSLTLTSTGGDSCDLRAIEVDGVILKDSTTQNLAFGTNGFYLPMDGNLPIGQDQSGKGNNWTPDNFGGSAALDKATGAKPILNTVSSGRIAAPSVFGSGENQTIAVTVSNPGSGNKYYLDGSLTPNLAFTRGSTITFNTGDSSGNGHPFKLSSTNASGSGGSEYTDGVAYYINGSVVSGSDYVTNYSSGAASGFRGIKWTVPHNQSTTYYYCTIHTGMGNNGAFTSTIDETKADPYAWKCVLALPLVGSDDDVSNSVNSGSVTKATTVSGAVANYAFSNFYGGSYYFDGSNDYISVADSTDYDFGTADFTTEVWFYATSISGDQYIMNFNGGAANAGHNGINIYNGNWRIGGFNNYLIGGNVGLVANKWTHVAISRESGTLRVFVDGSKIGETSANVSFDSTSAITFGSNVGGSLNFGPGYMQDARVYRGVAKYTSNFIPASTDPDILLDTPSGVSGSSKLTKITDGAVDFDGTGDTLTIPQNTNLDFGSGECTVECFLYISSHAADKTIVGRWESSDQAWQLAYGAGGSNNQFSFMENMVQELKQLCHQFFLQIIPNNGFI